MKKLILSFFFLTIIQQAKAENNQMPISAFVIQWTSAWCGSNSGALIAQVNGGVAPYSFFWNGIPGTDTLLGVPAGIYDLLVIDAQGDSAQSSGMVNAQVEVPFSVISIAMSNPGSNNGAFQVVIYPGPSANDIPQGTYNYNLYDSTALNLLATHTFSYYVGGAIDPYYIFDSLPAGKYYVHGVAPFGCYTQVEFRIKELPTINPTFSVSDACNGSPTGNLSINLHPYPAINNNTFNSNLISSYTGAGNAVTSKYKTIITDSVNNTVGYRAVQDSLLDYKNLLPGNYTLKVFTGDTIYSQGIPNIQDSILIYSTPFTIVNDPNCSLVKGRVFGDYNSNCSYGFGDILFSGTLVELNPGGYSSVTNAAGEFFIPVVNGTYTLKQYAPYQFAQVCPDTTTFTINITTPGTLVDVQVADSVNVNPDLQVGISGNQPRPGFNHHYKIDVRNLTPKIIPAQTLTVSYDTTLNFVNAVPAPATNSNGVLMFTGISLPPFGTASFQINTVVPSTTPLGTVLNASALITTVVGETIISNNIDSISQTVAGSFDPNDKAVMPHGFDAAGYITAAQQLKYTIRFQNTGTDTAFAVMIADTLPLSLNKYSLSVLNTSHPFTYEFASGNVVKFHFDNILLPDSNSNEPASHGYIKFKIDQIPGNAAGTVIQNNAAIYFDFNSPVITNTVTNTVFDCNQMATVTLSNSTICENDSIQANSALLFDMNSEWLLDGTSYSNDSSFYLTGLSAGNYSLTFVASNLVCSQSIINNINVNPIPPQPFITNIANTLQSSSVSGNQWLLSGLPIGGATATSYIPTATGFYSVMVTDVNGCTKISDSIYILITSINNIGSANICIYPNPVKDELIISGLTNGENVLTVFDAVGKVVLSVITSNTKEKIKTTFTKGIYFISIKNALHQIQMLRFTKE